jgi:hypothetical protein
MRHWGRGLNVILKCYVKKIRDLKQAHRGRSFI